MHFLQGRPRGQSVIAVESHSSVHVPLTTVIEKEHKQEFRKKNSCRNQKEVGVGG